MPHYKSPDNSLHFIESIEFEYLLPIGSIQITEEEVEALRPVPLPLPIQPISPRQIRMALTRAGLRTYVEAAVASGDQDLKDWWEFSTSFERLNPQVIAMGEALGKTAEELDGLWLLGASL
jgi:hypothetical protein